MTQSFKKTVYRKIEVKETIVEKETIYCRVKNCNGKNRIIVGEVVFLNAGLQVLIGRLKMTIEDDC